MSFLDKTKTGRAIQRLRIAGDPNPVSDGTRYTAALGSALAGAIGLTFMQIQMPIVQAFGVLWTSVFGAVAVLGATNTTRIMSDIQDGDKPETGVSLDTLALVDQDLRCSGLKRDIRGLVRSLDAIQKIFDENALQSTLPEAEQARVRGYLDDAADFASRLRITGGDSEPVTEIALYRSYVDALGVDQYDFRACVLHLNREDAELRENLSQIEKTLERDSTIQAHVPPAYNHKRLRVEAAGAAERLAAYMEVERTLGATAPMTAEAASVAFSGAKTRIAAGPEDAGEDLSSAPASRHNTLERR